MKFEFDKKLPQFRFLIINISINVLNFFLTISARLAKW